MSRSTATINQWPAGRRPSPVSVTAMLKVYEPSGNDSYSCSSEGSTFDVRCIGSKNTTITEKNKQRKCVSFADEDEVYDILHFSDIPFEVHEAVWYDSEEYAVMKAQLQLTVAKIECGVPLGEDETPRGLEARTQEGAWARYEIRRDALHAVMDEQDRQWARKYEDVEWIRDVYMPYSMLSTERAIAKANKDEQRAIKILKSIMPPRMAKRKVSGGRRRCSLEATVVAADTDADAESITTSSSNSSCSSSSSVSTSTSLRRSPNKLITV